MIFITLISRFPAVWLDLGLSLQTTMTSLPSQVELDKLSSMEVFDEGGKRVLFRIPCPSVASQLVYWRVG